MVTKKDGREREMKKNDTFVNPQMEKNDFILYSQQLINDLRSYNKEDFMAVLQMYIQNSDFSNVIQQLIEKMIIFNDFTLLPGPVIGEIYDQFDNYMDQLIDASENEDYELLLRLDPEQNNLPEMKHSNFIAMKRIYEDTKSRHDEKSSFFQASAFIVLTDYLNSGHLYEFSLFVAALYFDQHALKTDEFLEMIRIYPEMKGVNFYSGIS